MFSDTLTRCCLSKWKWEIVDTGGLPELTKLLWTSSEKELLKKYDDDEHDGDGIDDNDNVKTNP